MAILKMPYNGDVQLDPVTGEYILRTVRGVYAIATTHDIIINTGRQDGGNVLFNGPETKIISIRRMTVDGRRLPVATQGWFLTDADVRKQDESVVMHAEPYDPAFKRRSADEPIIVEGDVQSIRGAFAYVQEFVRRYGANITPNIFATLLYLEGGVTPDGKMKYGIRGGAGGRYSGPFQIGPDAWAQVVQTANELNISTPHIRREHRAARMTLSYMRRNWKQLRSQIGVEGIHATLEAFGVLYIWYSRVIARARGQLSARDVYNVHNQGSGSYMKRKYHVFFPQTREVHTFLGTGSLSEAASRRVTRLEALIE